jgi:RNA polymerase sigma-70 factor (ECF subfamily)
VKSSWHRFLDAFEPVRPDLYRYCRHLTRSAWDADDLAQDTLMRAFATLGTLFGDLPNPRAWLFRVASNLWIDRVRRSRHEVPMEVPAEVPGQAPAEAASSGDPRAAREAAGSILVRLSPHERAAVVLKDVFDLSLDEVAEALSTTVGAVKAALHRGRGRMVGPEPVASAPAAGVLDAFAAAFNAGDLERLTRVLLDSATVEIAGLVTEYGPEAARDPRTGSLAGTMSPITRDDRGGVAEALLEGYIPGIPRCEVRAYRGASILLFWYQHVDGPRVRTVMTAETEGDRLARLRNYFFSPELIAEVCQELGVPHRVNGYRYW